MSTTRCNISVVDTDPDFQPFEVRVRVNSATMAELIRQGSTVALNDLKRDIRHAVDKHMVDRGELCPVKTGR